MSVPRQRTVVCLYEDRPRNLQALRVAVVGLVRHAPGWSVDVFASWLAPEDERWFAALPGVRMRADRLSRTGWDVKPEVLLLELREGATDVVWWDSDLVACGDVLSTLERDDEGTFVALEDTWWAEAVSSGERAAAWGLPVGRELPSPLNSGALRVTQRHLPLIERWAALLGDPRYVAAQQLPGDRRPLHLNGDQEVLSALLSSKAFEQVPLRLVPRGTGVAQCWGPAGFTVLERLRALRTGGPALAHSIVTRPWLVGEAGYARLPRRPVAGSLRAYYDGLHAELSPYTYAARSLRDELPGRPAWLYDRSRTRRVLEWLPGSRLIIPELPMAMLDTALRLVLRRIKPRRRPASDLLPPTADALTG